jgi:nicotinamide mononucleotide transporter
MSPIEIIGFVSGAACVFLAVRQRIWNWPVGIINSGAWLILFWSHRLFLDALLQVFYIVVGFIGWYWWLYGKNQKAAGKRNELPVTKTGRKEVLVLTLIGAVCVAILAPLQHHFGDSAPLVDSATTSASLIAQYMLTKKLMGNWYLWFSVDIVYTVLYASQHLYLTAALQPIFAGLCIAGFVSWRRTLNAEAATTDTDVELTEAAA